MASGGLSHFLVNEELDREVIEALQRKDHAALKALPMRKLLSGSSEIRNWIAVAAAVKDLELDWISYVPGYRSRALTGVGLCLRTGIEQEQVNWGSSDRSWIAAAMLLAGVITGARLAVAQDYPAKPVRVVVPFAAGAGTDLTGRLVAQELSNRLGQQFFIENKPGAAAQLGTDLVAKAQPDGYTLLWTVTDGLSVLPAIKAVPYTIPDDFAFIAASRNSPMWSRSIQKGHLLR